MEVHLDRVALRGHVALLDLLVVDPDLPPHLVVRRQRTLTRDEVGDPSGLRLGQRHDRAERLHQPDEEQSRVLRVDDPSVEVDVVLARGHHPLVEEREGHLVAGAVDDRVELGRPPVGEEHLRALEPVDVRHHGDVAVPEPGQQVVADRGVRVQHGVVGLRQPVVGDLALRDPQHRRHAQLLERERTTRERRLGQVVGRHAEHELRDDVSTAAHRQVGLVSHPRRLDRDVARRVADPQHQDALALEGVGGAVVVRVQLGAGERVAARVGRLGPARVPVVAVRDDDVAVDAGLRLARLAVLAATDAA